MRNPHAAADKRLRVQRMFAAIAPSYDLNNRLHSLWLDQHWRRKAVNLSNVTAQDTIVDVACGTGDLTLKFFQRLRRTCGIDGEVLRAGQILGVDFTFQMLPIARRKAKRVLLRERTGQDVDADTVQFINGDAQSLPLPDTCADVISIAFGIRNVAEPGAAIREFFRILRPGGRLVILEFSLPTHPLLRAAYNFYFRNILPRTATLVSGDKTGAYKYLPESVNTFIGRERLVELMRDEGFDRVEQFPMTVGVCVCYRAVKR